MIHFASPMAFLLIPLLIGFIIYLKQRDNKRRKSLLNFPQYLVVDDINKSGKMKLYLISSLFIPMKLNLQVI